MVDNIIELTKQFTEILNIDDIDKYLKNSKQDDGRLHCTVNDVCTTSYTRLNELRKHIIRVHSSLEKDKFYCEDCDISYSNKSNLTKHLSKTHKVGGFICEIDNCGKKFVTSSLLNSHKNSHNIECTVCGAVFGKRSVLDKHIEQIHLKKESDFDLCPFKDCGQNRHINGFKSYDNMISHVLHYHVKLCKVCWNTFNSANEFQNHECSPIS